jgi:HK97 family phage major capsid protein
MRRLHWGDEDRGSGQAVRGSHLVEPSGSRAGATGKDQSKRGGPGGPPHCRIVEGAMTTRDIDKFTPDRKLRELRDELRAELDDCPDPSSGQAQDARARLDLVEGAIERRAGRQRVLERAAQNPGNLEQGTPPVEKRRRDDDGTPAHVRALHDEAFRTIENHDNVLSARAADNLDRLIRTEDGIGVLSEYVSAVGAPEYRVAFGKLMAYGQEAILRLTPEEAASVRRVTTAMEQRGMTEGTGSAGGYGVPVVVDPTILLSSNGQLNPIRDLARVFSISGSNKWTGVSGSVTASFAAEEAEAGDGTPTLAQPVVQVRKAHCFVPFSIEAGQDYEGLTDELARSIADAKDVVEAQKFLDGLASANEPVGILASVGGLSNTVRTLTTTTAVTAIADAYLLKQGLPPRALPGGTFVMHPTVIDVFRRFVGNGNTTEPFIVENGRFLNYPLRPWANMVTTTTTTGSNIGLFADFKQAYAVVDRVGLSVELLPLLVGTNHRPTGQRGVYAWWRVGGSALVENMARFLQVK